MTPLAFFRTGEARRLLQRAAHAAGMPLSLHFVEEGEEGPRITAWSACAACKYVAALPDGRRACRASRRQPAIDAIRQRRPIPFLCHMGFGCVSAPALAGESFVLTLGPYVPMGAAESLEYEAGRGLEALGEDGQAPLPFSLEDLHHVPVSAVPALAEWLCEGLQAAYQAARAAGEPEDPAALETSQEAAPARRGRRRPTPSALEPYAAAGIAAALAAGDQPLARELLLGVLAETEAQPRRRIPVQRGRTVAAVGAALEALENTGLDTAPGWETFGQFLAQVRDAGTPAAMLDAAMLVLGPLRRRARQQPAPAMDYTALNDLVNARLYEPLTLEEVAGILGESATAISHRLRRKFGMSYSEYVGRLRIGKAKELLRRTKLSATEVAQRVGISDQSNFSRLFRRYEGMSPLAYRQQHGKKR